MRSVSEGSPAARSPQSQAIGKDAAVRARLDLGEERIFALAGPRDTAEHHARSRRTVVREDAHRLQRLEEGHATDKGEVSRAGDAQRPARPRRRRKGEATASREVRLMDGLGLLGNAAIRKTVRAGLVVRLGDRHGPIAKVAKRDRI